MAAFKSGPRPSGKQVREDRKDKKRQPNKNIPKGESSMGPVPADKRKKEAYEQKQNKEGRIIGDNFYPKMAKGGRIGLKAGSKGCKLALRGKGRAYGKNS